MKININNKISKKFRIFGFSGRGDPSDGGRFKYRPLKKGSRRKTIILILIIAAIVITLLSIFVFWPMYWAEINLNYQLYFNKAAGLNFIEINFLNFWSNYFFWNKTALIGGFIGSIIMSIPPDRILLTTIGTRLRFGKPSRKKALLFWWTAGFFIFFLLGHFIDSSGQFSWTIYLIQQGQIEFNAFTIIPNAFNVLLNPQSLDMTSIFIYNNLYLPLIMFIIGVFIFRAALKVLQNIYIRRNDYQLVANSLFIGALILGVLFFYLPTLALDGIQITQSWSIILAFFALLGFGLFTLIYGKSKTSQDPRNYIIFTPEKKRLGILGVILLIIIIMPLLFSIWPTINLTSTEMYKTQQWEAKYKRQVEWTTLTAGLDMIEERPIDNYTQTTSQEQDLEMIQQIRQYDQSAAIQSMAPKISTTFEGLSDSDIVYFNGSEYWVAPKTIRINQFAGDSVATNTELYDHIEGFVAIDTYNGELVNVSNIFNISEQYPLFFGESECDLYLSQQGLTSTGRLGGYDSNILLNTGWQEGIEKNTHIYEGEPDGILSGLEGFYYTASLGLWGYVGQPEHSYLINRNVRSRVENILLPNMKIDSDPYLVFDSEKGKMYYAVSIYTSVPIGSYATTPIYRFLGVALVDQWNGELSFYKNPALEGLTNDITYPLWKIYIESYEWKDSPDWLKSQMRYPQDLFELQLEANYKYHVDSFSSWRRGDDFHERPEDADLFYIETCLGEGIEFVALDVVRYLGQEARALAGLYIMRHGDNFGNAIFYHTRDAPENVIGPKTARDSYISTASKTFSLIQGPRNGNTLIYPLLSSIYYYIPTYSTVGDIQDLNLAGFVNGFTRKVGYGQEALEAYFDLEEFPSGAFILNSTAEDPDRDGRFRLTWTESQYADSYEIYQNGTLMVQLDSSQRSYEITGLSTGDYEFEVRAVNEYGQESNKIEVSVLITIDSEFSMGDEIHHPNDLARFRIKLENIVTNFSASAIGVEVNLTLYSTNNETIFSIYGVNSPLVNITERTSSYVEANYTIVDISLFPGQGEIISGWVNSSKSNEIIYYSWTFIIPGEEPYITDLAPIHVYS